MTTHNDDGSIIEDVVLSQESGNYGVDIPKNVWHMVEALVLGSGVFECEEGAFVVHEVEGILEVKSTKVGCDSYANLTICQQRIASRDTLRHILIIRKRMALTSSYQYWC